MNPDNQYMKNNILIMNIQEKCQKFLSEGFLKNKILKNMNIVNFVSWKSRQTKTLWNYIFRGNINITNVTYLLKPLMKLLDRFVYMYIYNGTKIDRMARFVLLD